MCVVKQDCCKNRWRKTCTDPPALPVIVLWPVTCPSPLNGASLWKGYQKGLRCTVLLKIVLRCHPFYKFSPCSVLLPNFLSLVFLPNFHSSVGYKFSRHSFYKVFPYVIFSEFFTMNVLTNFFAFTRFLNLQDKSFYEFSSCETSLRFFQALYSFQPAIFSRRVLLNLWFFLTVSYDIPVLFNLNVIDRLVFDLLFIFHVRPVGHVHCV